VDWFFDTLSDHSFLVLLVPLGLGVALLLIRDRSLKKSGIPREEWPQFYIRRPITPASNMRGLFVLCALGLGDILVGFYEEYETWGKLLWIGGGIALVVAGFIIYYKTRLDIERAVTIPIDPNHPSGGAM
jgi:hypothetical protein